MDEAAMKTLARNIILAAESHAKQPDNPEGPDTNTFVMDLIFNALKVVESFGYQRGLESK